MPKPEFKPPVLGVSDAMPAIEQARLLTDPRGLLNVVPQDGESGRGRLATRDKLAVEFDGAQGSGPVACIGDISRASGITGVQVTSVTRSTTGSSRTAGAIRGQCFALERDRTLLDVFYDSRGTYSDGSAMQTPPSDAGGYASYACCWNATDPDIGYFVTIARDSAAATNAGTAPIITGVNRVSISTHAVTHQKYCIDAQAPYSVPTTGNNPLLPNNVVQFGPYLFVAVWRYIYVFRADDLTYIRRHEADWAAEVQCLQVATIRGRDYLLALFTGSATVDGPVANDGGASPTERYGEFARCGISAWELLYANSTLKTSINAGHSALNRKRLPQGTQSGDTYYEDHGTFRFSDWSAGRFRGCLAYSFALEVDSDHNVYAYVTRTNQGFGYDGAQSDQRPDGTSPYITVCRAVLTRGFESNAPRYMAYGSELRYGLSEDVGGWERDTDSLRRSFAWRTSTFLTDIPAINSVTGIRSPETADNEPSLKACCLDTTNRRVFVAGRRNALSGVGSNVFCLDADTGDILWEEDVAGKVQQNALALDPVSKNVFLAMTRNDDWTNAEGVTSGVMAEVLELNGANGQTVNAFDLTDGVVFNGYITALNQETLGTGAFGVAVNSRSQALISVAPVRYDT